jgi:hypothetical protein
MLWILKKVQAISELLNDVTVGLNQIIEITTRVLKEQKEALG